jgi:hypothetical protein
VYWAAPFGGTATGEQYEPAGWACTFMPFFSAQHTQEWGLVVFRCQNSHLSSRSVARSLLHVLFVTHAGMEIGGMRMQRDTTRTARAMHVSLSQSSSPAWLPSS